ncbi:conserved hypothetical protein [Lebetimonas natsushimae]|uniref:Uncharacterized protein n=1 Tax=Lebetimonas natsushimae TaxID=1936991 RepID=A0A292YB56_9BACT|nr:hypothetical protein [Lebetimonas natsushimae]GAX88202.1 conserved hypothetical protein [Lebetimonas natsushimae]
MNQITLKILNHIAKKQNSDIIEVFSVFLANITSGNEDFEKVALKIFDLNKLNDKEINLLKDFFDYLREDVDNDKNFKEKLCLFVEDYKKTATDLASFFVIFLPKDVIFSKNPEKIKDSLSIYPKEIKEAIIKAIEFLSLLTTDIDNNTKKEIFQNIIEIMIILSGIMKVLGESNEI